MSKQAENKQAAPAVDKKAKTGAGKVWRLTSPEGRVYVTSDPAEAHHLTNTRGYREVKA